jgi:hypothetical protein
MTEVSLFHPPRYYYYCLFFVINFFLEIEKVITASLNSRELQSCYFLFFILSVILSTNLSITLMDEINAMAMAYINIINAIIVT